MLALFEVCCSELHSDAGGIWVADPQRAVLHPRASWPDGNHQDVALPGSGLIEHVFESGEPEEVATTLAFPIIGARGVTGVVELLFRDEAHRMADEWPVLLRLIGTLVGSEIERDARIAHDLNNVLMGIDTFATVLQRRASDDVTRNAVSHIRQSLERGRAITEDMLSRSSRARRILR